MRFLTDDWKTDLRRLATGGAWLFVGGSMLALIWLIASGAGFGGDGRVFGSTVHGHEYTAPLLAYHGFFGAAWIWIQLATLVAATGLTFMPWARQRRIGHALLVGWAGLWTLGALRMAAVDPGVFWTVQSLFMISLMGCTGFRAYQGWSPPEVPPTLRFESPNDDLLKTEPASNTPRTLLADDVTGPSRADDTLKSTAQRMWTDVRGFARTVLARARSAGQAATPTIRAAAQRIRQSWPSSSRSA